MKYIKETLDGLPHSRWMDGQRRFYRVAEAAFTKGPRSAAARGNAEYEFQH